MRPRIYLSLLLALVVPLNTIAAQSWNGIWRIPGKKPQSELRTIDHGGGAIEFQFELWRGPPSYNSGSMEGRMSIKEGTAAFETTEFQGLCRIEFEFAPDHVIVRQAAGSWLECGFGFNVFADGKFARVSTTVPKFIRR